MKLVFLSTFALLPSTPPSLPSRCSLNVRENNTFIQIMPREHLSLYSIVIWSVISFIPTQMVDRSTDDDLSTFISFLPIPPGCEMSDASFFVLREPFTKRMEAGLDGHSPFGDTVTSLIDTIEGTKNDSSSRRCYYHQCFSKHHLGAVRTACGLICCSEQPSRQQLIWQKSLCDRISKKSDSRGPPNLVMSRDWSLMFEIHGTQDKLESGQQCCSFDVYKENWQFIQCLAMFHPTFFLSVHMRFIETKKVLAMIDELEGDELSMQQGTGKMSHYPIESYRFALWFILLVILYQLPFLAKTVRSILSFIFLVSITQSYLERGAKISH